MSDGGRYSDLVFEELTDSRWDEPQDTEKFSDGATAQRVFGDYAVRRYKPFSFWRVITCKTGSVPSELQGVYTTADEARRAIETYEAKRA